MKDITIQAEMDSTQNGYRDSDSKAEEYTKEYTRQSKFGIGRWRPESLQFLANMWAFIGLYMPTTIVQATFRNYCASQVQSIENYFNISSSKTGLLFIARDIGSMCFSIIGSHLGSTSNIPRWLAMSGLTLGIALLSLSVVQIATPRTLPSDDISRDDDYWKQAEYIQHLCWNNETISKYLPFLNATSDSFNTINATPKFSFEDNDENGGQWTFYWCFVVLFLIGVATSYSVPLQMIYVEQNVPEASQAGLFIGQNGYLGFVVCTTGMAFSFHAVMGHDDMFTVLNIMAMYFGPSGILTAGLVIGLPVGYFLGGLMNKVPIDLSDTEMQTSDPRWISAWWLGFVILGPFALLTSLPVFCFPRHLIHRKPEPAVEVTEDGDGYDRKDSKTETIPDGEGKPSGHLLNSLQQVRDYSSVSHAKTDQTKQMCELQSDSKKTEQRQGSIKSLSPRDTRGLSTSLKRILSNPVIILLALTTFLSQLAIQGVMAFKLKFFQDEFDKSSSSISFHLGVGQLFTAVSGTLLGGYLVSRLKLSRVAMFKAAVIAQVGALCFGAIGPFLGCDNHRIVGFNEFSSNATDVSCRCSNDTVLFICGSDGNNYLSPCIAGCQDTDGLNYMNCSSIGGGGSARPGFCDNGCIMYWPALIAVYIQSFFVTFEIALDILMVIRSVAPEDQSLASGLVTGFFQRAASVAGPIIFGKLYDSTCLLWPAGDGACQLSDKVDLLYVVIGAGVSLRIISFLVMVAATILAHRKDKQAQASDVEVLVPAGAETRGGDSGCAVESNNSSCCDGAPVEDACFCYNYDGPAEEVGKGGSH